MKHKTSLKQAQKDPEAMKQFIVEHEGDEIEERDFEKVVGSMMGKLDTESETKA